MTDKKEDLKIEGEVTSKDNGQSLKETLNVTEEIDSLLNVDEENKESLPSIKTDEYDENSVIVAKKDLDFLKKKSEEGINYKNGLLAIKRNLKKGKVNKKETIETNENDFLKKDDFYKSIEKTAIKKVQSENPDIKDNWSDVVGYYSPRNGKNTVEDIIKDIVDAHTLYRKDNPMNDEENKKSEEDNKKILSKIASDKAKAKIGSENRGTETKEKTVLKKRQPVSSWYSDKKSK